MTYYFDPTGFIGQIISGLTTNVTGSLFLTLFLIFIFLALIAMAFRLPIIAAGVLFLPLLITLMSMTNDFFALGGVALIYLGVSLGQLFYFG